MNSGHTFCESTIVVSVSKRYDVFAIDVKLASECLSDIILAQQVERFNHSEPNFSLIEVGNGGDDATLRNA
jgi:hypothetical protein